MTLLDWSPADDGNVTELLFPLSIPHTMIFFLCFFKRRNPKDPVINLNGRNVMGEQYTVS